MQTVLRQSVTVIPIQDGFTLEDTATGFITQVTFDDGIPVGLLEAESLENSLVVDFWSYMSSLGLVDESLSLSDILARQRADLQGQLADKVSAIRAQLEFNTSVIPFYRARQEQYAPQLIQVEQDLERMPLLGKADIRANFPDGFISADRKDAHILFSSGSSEERVQVWAEMERPLFGAEEVRGLRLIGRLEFKRAQFTTPRCLATECHLSATPMEQRISAAAMRLDLNSTTDLFSMRRDLVENVLEEIDQFGPECLIADPMYLHWLGRLARELNLPLPKLEFILLSYEYPSMLQRNAISRLFECPIFSFYGATETGLIAEECRHGRLHVREDLVVLNTVKRDGSSTGNEIGRLAVTHISREVTPLVRYLVGDIARFENQPCTCVLRDWSCIELHGRMNDVMWLNQKWVTTKEFDEIMSGCEGVDFYSCIQTDTNRIEVDVVPALGAEVRITDMQDWLKERLGVSIAKVRIVRRLEPQQSLKFRLTESRAAGTPEWV